MRTDTRTLHLYTFDELDEDARERARDWFREGLEFEFDFVVEDAAEVADLLGIDLRLRTVNLAGGGTQQAPSVYFSGLYSQGDGASYNGNYAYRRGSARAVRKHAPEDAELHRIADVLAELQRRYFYSLTARVHQSGRQVHEMTMLFDIDAARDLPEDDEEALKDALRDFARWIYRRLESEWEYQLSNETIDESIRANGYEFNERGEWTP